MAWISLKRAAVSLHVGYAATYSNNLSAHNARVRTEPEFELALDLNPNLKTRNRETNTYLDARELADGAISSLTVVQLDDEYLLERLATVIELANRPSEWTLTIELSGSHRFRVRPEAGQFRSLYLRVNGAAVG
jgi:hypothetical protein